MFPLFFMLLGMGASPAPPATGDELCAGQLTFAPSLASSLTISTALATRTPAVATSLAGGTLVTGC